MKNSEYSKAKESQILEFKDAQKGLPASVFETYCSFANTKGGTIVLGIKEGEKANVIVGVSNVKNLKKVFSTRFLIKQKYPLV